MMLTEASPSRQNVGAFRTRLLALATALLVLLAHVAPARAAELPPAVKALLDVIGLRYSLQPKAGAVREVENGYELEDITFLELKAPDGTVLVSLHTDRMRITGAREDDGLFLYAHIRLENTRALLPVDDDPAKKMRLEIPVVDLVEASVLPEAAARDELEKLASTEIIASAISMPEATFNFPEFGFTWKGLKGTWKGDRRKGTGITDIEFGEITIPLKKAALINPREGRRNAAVLERLGLITLTITGRTHQETVVKPDARLHASSETRLGAREVGFLDLKVEDVSFPVAMLGQLRDYMEKMRDRGTGGMMGRPPMPGYNPLTDPVFMNLISQATLRGIEIGWKDRGITRKLLEMAAEREGRSVDEVVRERMQKAQIVLAAFLPPELLEKTLNALMTYLRDPKNIRISMRGAGGQFITVPALVSAFMNPQALFSLLQVDIVANE